ncbi:hypothetical protein BOTBODRAFT_31263 [Botryobasidium botryosum FD-172 SS1]|uniref:Prokaryotic-type class I peptide chain release factors domain-containing protein n=1 Tax=Botryobasidium botryosum (strain FD-172 SS1) TaxID=930990 RepID=A0A067MM35_BOTB1|nr:hypothetical protein BOTBODRAFT_31263 [Botryobasidium botryosum FD-172 SS1]
MLASRLTITVLSRPTPAISKATPALIRTLSTTPLPKPPHLTQLTTPEEHALARTWVAAFKNASLSRSDVELSFSRSSGPGGQHVNKVNTKATVRCSLDAYWMPVWARDGLVKTPAYVPSTSSLLITSMQARSQSQNVDDCLLKLHALVLAKASAPLKNEPSEEQRARVRALERAEKTRNKVVKKTRSDVKQGRRKGGWD